MSGIRSLHRGPTQKGYATAASAPIRVDSTTNQVWVNPLATGVVETPLFGAYPYTASSSATVTLTAAMSGGKFLMDRTTGTSYTLPVPVAGMEFHFLCSATQASGANVVITDAGTTLLVGSVIMFSGEKVTPSSTLGPYQFNSPVASSYIKITMNGTTTGGEIGTFYTFRALSTTRWMVSGVVNSPSGNLATPFST